MACKCAGTELCWVLDMLGLTMDVQYDYVRLSGSNFSFFNNLCSLSGIKYRLHTQAKIVKFDMMVWDDMESAANL